MISPPAIAAAHGGTTSIIDFAVQYKANLWWGIDNWHKGRGQMRDRLRLSPDHRTRRQQIEEMYTVMDEGVTASKCSWLSRRFLVDDATIFAPCPPPALAAD
jgi:hypothetical protein